MKNVPRWTIWIPVAGIFFFRLRIEMEKEEQVKPAYVLGWTVYWVLTTTAILLFLIFTSPIGRHI